jgi:two-component system chemotaxis response regulator CheB
MEAPARRIRVLVIDDSPLVQRLLTELLATDPGIEVVGTASDAFAARAKIKQLNPDVLTLDVEMPKMDGVTFLRNLMRLRPMPVVMVSSLTSRGAEITLDALSLGAVDCLPKPRIDLAARLVAYREELLEKIHTAAGARVRVLPLAEQSGRWRQHGATPSMRQPAPPGTGTQERLIAVGASTGGTEAIKQLLLGMPADAPGIVIAQHIPRPFSTAFAARLDRLCALKVSEAADGAEIRPGHAFVAPGDLHLLVLRSGPRWICRLDAGPAVNRHRPSVDVLFRSVAQQAGADAVGILLTGMGKDGAQGLKEMRNAGATTLVQDEASSVVWGMPGEAVALDAADEVLPLSRIAARALACASETPVTAPVA